MLLERWILILRSDCTVSESGKSPKGEAPTGLQLPSEGKEKLQRMSLDSGNFKEEHIYMLAKFRPVPWS
jgi:hypothetical protein